MAEFMTNLKDLTVEDLTVTGTLTTIGAHNLKDLTVEDLTVTGTLATTGAHTPTGGLTFPTTAKAQFRDSAIFINSSVDGQMDVDADAEVEITTTLVDLNGNLDVSGTTLLGDTVTVATNKKIQLRDPAIYLNSSADGQLDIDADAEVEITTGLVDLNGNLDVSGTAVVAGAATFTEDVTADIITASIFNQTRVGYKHDFDETAAALASTSMNYYYTGGGTSGTQAIVASEGGVIQLSTTSTGSSSSTLTYAGSIVADNDKEWEFKTRFKLNNITNTKVDIGMYVDANDEILFRFDTAVNAENLYLVTKNNNGDEVVEDTTVDVVVDTWIEVAIEAAADDSFEVYINDTQVLATHTGTIRNVAFKPYAYVDNKAAAEEKILSIDYISFNQNR